MNLVLIFPQNLTSVLHEEVAQIPLAPYPTASINISFNAILSPHEDFLIINARMPKKDIT